MVRLGLVFWLLTSFQAHSQQKQAAIWIYGEGNLLDFRISPIKSKYTKGGGSIGVSAISDSNGTLQFFSTPQNVWNRTGVFMPHGKVGTGFSNSAQGQLIIGRHDSTHLFRLFINVVGDQPFLTSRVVNMKLHGGLGDVDTTTIRIVRRRIADQLACMLHANGKDSWLIARVWNSDSLLAYHVTDHGIADSVFTDINSPAKRANFPPPKTTSGDDSQLKSSPDSRMLLIPRRTVEYPYHELLRFDRATGVFSNKILIKDTLITSGLFVNSYPDGCFSPDSRLLYLSSGFRRAISSQTDGPGFFWQYSLESYDSAAIENSKVYLGKIDRFAPTKPELKPFSPRLQLAMDGKIYISPGSSLDSLMSIIQCPNTIGTECKLQFRVLNLREQRPVPFPYVGYNGAYFPTLNQTFVRNAGIFQLQANKRKLCQGDTLELSGYGAGAEHFTWSVSPALPQGTKVDTLTWQKIPTTTIPPGSYTFTCQAFSRCGDLFEKSITVQINPNPSPSQPPQRGGVSVPCTGDSVFLYVPNHQAGYRYFWSTGQVADSIVVKHSGKYSLDSVATAQGCGIKTADTILVTIKEAPIPPPPLISGPSLVEICEGQTARLKVETQNAKVVWSNGVEGDSVVVAGGQYSVISETAEGCQSAASEPVTVVEVPNPTPVFVNIDSVLTRETLENQNYCVAGMPGTTFSFSVEGGTIVDSSEDCVTVNWTSVPPSWARGPALVVAERLAGLGCEGVAAQQFSYRPQIQIPTLITPNTDDRNDTFVIEDLEFYPNHHLQIFNRWGKKVLDTRHYQNDWKGEEGIYFYNLVVGGMEMKGWVQVVR